MKPVAGRGAAKTFGPGPKKTEADAVPKKPKGSKLGKKLKGVML